MRREIYSFLVTWEAFDDLNYYHMNAEDLYHKFDQFIDYMDTLDN
jgi:hypothetical protein